MKGLGQFIGLHFAVGVFVGPGFVVQRDAMSGVLGWVVTKTVA